MFRHCVYSKVLREPAPLTATKTTISFQPFNRRGDGLFLIFQLANSVAGGSFDVQVVGSFDGGVTFVALGATPNFVQSVVSGSAGDTIFRISGALPPIVGLSITQVGAPSGDVSVLARGSVGLDSAGVGYRPQDYVPPHTHGFEDGLTDYPTVFPQKARAPGISLNPSTTSAAFATIPDMILPGLVPPPSAINVRRWEATIQFDASFLITAGPASAQFRIVRDGVPLAGARRNWSGIDEWSAGVFAVVPHDAGVAHTYAVEWRQPAGPPGTLTIVDDNRLLTVEFRPVA